MTVHPVQIVITVVAVVVLLSPLLLWAFRAGCRSSSTGKSARFDRVTPDLRLNDTWWRVEFDAEDAAAAPRVGSLHLRQVGARVFGEFQSTDGQLQAFEGLLHGRRLCYVSLDESRRSETVGTLLAEVQPDESQIIGVRGCWSGPAQGFLLRKAVFTRLNSRDAGLEPNVNR